MKLDGKTNEELLKLKSKIESDPLNKATGLYLYTPAALKKMKEIDLQITHNLAMKRQAEGRPVPCDGYSGRKSKRHR